MNDIKLSYSSFLGISKTEFDQLDELDGADSKVSKSIFDVAKQIRDIAHNGGDISKIKSNLCKELLGKIKQIFGVDNNTKTIDATSDGAQIIYQEQYDKNGKLLVHNEDGHITQYDSDGNLVKEIKPEYDPFTGTRKRTPFNPIDPTTY